MWISIDRRPRLRSVPQESRDVRHRQSGDAGAPAKVAHRTPARGGALSTLPRNARFYLLDKIVINNICFFTCYTCKNTKINTLMILPQVPLRKPCYDFYFL